MKTTIDIDTEQIIEGLDAGELRELLTSVVEEMVEKGVKLSTIISSIIEDAINY
jgi:hypothetical protein